MGSLLQSALLRLATWLLWLASRFGERRLERTESQALLAAAAMQAIDDAEERRQARRPRGTGRQDEGARLAGMSPVEPPAGTVAMYAKAQLSPMFGGALLLVDEAGRTFVPIFVGAAEALAFRTRLEREPYPRPLTHDLLDRLLERLGARVRLAQIDELRAGTFYARLAIELANGERFELDARPSDAIVLAVGAEAPIFVAEQVVREAGRRFDGGELGPSRVRDSVAS